MIAFVITCALWLWLVVTAYFWVIDYKPLEQRKAIRDRMRVTLEQRPHVFNRLTLPVVYSYALYPLRVVAVTLLLTAIFAVSGAYH